MQAAPSPMFRRLVLGGAFLAATLFALLPAVPPVDAADTPAAASAPLSAQAAADAAESASQAAEDAANRAREVAREARDRAREAKAEARAAEREASRSGARADTPRITIDRETPSGDRRVRIEMPGTDEEFQSFDQFVDRAPEIAVGVLLIVLIAFLTPIIIIILVIWYKMRKNRLLSETMVKLAEKGVMPSPEALQALGAGRHAPSLNAMASGLPLADQAHLVRKSVAWSDLRRGVFLAMAGLAFCLYSLTRSASANWLGLVLLFVGIGYIVLWYFEDQQVTASRAMLPPAVAPPQEPLN